MAHKSQKFQFEVVAVLGLLALFTHNHLFWVIGLFLAMIDLPDFSTPLRRIAGSVEKMAGVPPEQDPTEPPVEDATHAAATDEAKARIEKAAGAKAGAGPCLSCCSPVDDLPGLLYRRYRQGNGSARKSRCFRCGSSCDLASSHA
jgi:hypothetical protein